MSCRWQQAQTLTRILLRPPGDGQMDGVSPVAQVSIINTRKRGSRGDGGVQCHDAKCCDTALMCAWKKGEEEVVILFYCRFRRTDSVPRRALM